MFLKKFLFLGVSVFMKQPALRNPKETQKPKTAQRSSGFARVQVKILFIIDNAGILFTLKCLEIL